jgi:ornithine cyclodeaminase/alanine dehydrogenase-like protein (mu-crystallin family)
MLVLSRRDVLELLTLPECVEAVERAFRAHAEQRTLGPAVLSVSANGGGFHVKAAGLRADRSYFAAKTNANFPDGASGGPRSRAPWFSPTRTTASRWR